MSIVGLRSLMPPREILTSQRGTDDQWHAHYPTAARTLCNLAVLPIVRGRKSPPTCGSCAKTARAFDRIDASMPAHWRPPLKEVAAVGDFTGSGTAGPSSEPERAATASSGRGLA